MRQSPEEYETIQSFSRMTRWLHGRRFATALAFTAKAAPSLPSPIRILELGCGTGKLFEALNVRFPIEYHGIDVNDDYIKAALQRYGCLSNFHVERKSLSDLSYIKNIERYDIVFALETFEHVIESDLVRAIEALAAAAPQWLVCSVPIEVGPAVVMKNVGSWLTGYVRHKEYTWRETLAAGCYDLDKLPPHGTSHKGFDWRWLAQTIRHNFRIVERRHLPLNLMPAAMSSSVLFIAQPRARRVGRPRLSIFGGAA